MVLTDIAQAKTIVEKHSANNEKTGLITGGFDVLHIGHARLFKFAKIHVDKLIIGVDSSELANTFRPQKETLFNPQEYRIEVLDSITYVDYVFPLNPTKKELKNINLYHSRVLEKLKPTLVITNPIADLFFESRKRRCKKHKIQLLEYWNTNILEKDPTALV